MDTSPALLLLLALGLCCPGICGQSYEMKIRSYNSITQLQVGQRLELECQTDKDSGAFWIRQDKSGTLHFIAFISSISRVTFAGNQKTSQRFQASKDQKLYRLVVKSFTSQDEGNYFCLMNINQMLFFSPGQPLFFPERRMQEELNSFCHIFIWVPLAGLCLLLLQLLVTTIVLRRRKDSPQPPRDAPLA